MTIEYRVNGVLLTSRVRLLDEGSGFVSAAERGAIGTGGVLIDDPDGDLTINGWQSFTVDDTEAFPDNRVFTGVIADRGIGRGGRFKVGAGRVHDCSILDLNYLLHIHLLRTNAAKRAAETDVVRVAWLLTSEGLSGLVTDEGLVSTSNAINFLASDLRRRYPDDALTEVAPVAGKNFFVYRDVASGNAALFYDKNTASVWASPLRISNVPADVDGTTTFAPDMDANLERSPQDQYGGVSYGWLGDPIYVQSATTISTMGFLRDGVYDTNRVGLLATAQAQAQSFLNTRATETDIISFSVILPSAKVNQIMAGMEIDVKFSHLPGYSSGFTTTRIRRRGAIPISPTHWKLALELWALPTPVDDATLDLGTCSYTANVNPGTPSSDDIWGAAVTGPGAYNYAGTPPTPTTTFTGGISESGTFNISPKFGVNPGVFSGPQTFEARWDIDLGSATFICKAQLIATYPHPITLSPLALEYSDNGSSWTTAIAALDGTAQSVGTTAHRYWSLHYGPESVGAPGLWYYPGIDMNGLLLWSGTAGPDPFPMTTGLVSESLGFGDGTTVSFTTTYGFLTGTLVVLVDNVDQTAGITVTDALAGTFDLAFAPTSSEQVTVTYQAA